MKFSCMTLQQTSRHAHTLQEMCHTHRMYKLAAPREAGGRPELVIHARHKGFCKVCCVYLGLRL